MKRLLIIIAIAPLLLLGCQKKAELLTTPDLTVEEAVGLPSIESTDDPIWGDENSPITMVVFSDFQCPFCKAFFEGVDQLEADWISPGKLKVQFRDFPLAKHVNSLSAHATASAAHQQGAFLEMHRRLYSEQTEWASSTRPDLYFGQLAEQEGLNMTRFQADYNAIQTIEEIKQDRDEARLLGITGAPASFINGELYQGSLTLEQLLKILNEHDSNL